VNPIDGTHLFFASCTYEDILDVIEEVLMSRFVPQNQKLKGVAFKIASLPIGTLIFGKIAQVKARTAAKPFRIKNKKTWEEYTSTHVILENYKTKRRKITKKLQYFMIPTSCKICLAVVIEPVETSPRNTLSKLPTSTTSKEALQINKKKKLFIFPKLMTIDIVGPCTKLKIKTTQLSTQLDQLMYNLHSHTICQFTLLLFEITTTMI